MAQPARSSTVFTSFSPSLTSIAVVTPSISLQLVGDAERLAALVELGLDPRQIVLGAGLDLRRGVLVEALDRREFGELDIGEFLDRAEAFRGEQLADDLVDVERVHEGLGALDEFLLAALGSPRPRSGCRCPSR